MPVKTILLLRHGHRIAWTLDPTTGKYTSNVPFPTRLPADPPLASHGVRQAIETGEYFLESLTPLVKADRLRIYSSLFYRCLETLRPTVEKLRTVDPNLKVRGERGIGEWFGKAWFEQPAPGEVAFLSERWYPFLDEGYQSLVVPSRFGERIHELHDRVAKALEAVVQDVDREFEALGRGGEDVTLLLCGHAAQIICTGRALTGQMPEDPDEEDFQCYTCGVSEFVRKKGEHAPLKSETSTTKDWRVNGGVAGGWDCTRNSWCGHLSQGEERGWHFHGDESFDSYGQGQIRTEDGSVEDEAQKVSSKL